MNTALSLTQYDLYIRVMISMSTFLFIFYFRCREEENLLDFKCCNCSRQGKILKRYVLIPMYSVPVTLYL